MASKNWEHHNWFVISYREKTLFFIPLTVAFTSSNYVTGITPVILFLKHDRLAWGDVNPVGSRCQRIHFQFYFAIPLSGLITFWIGSDEWTSLYFPSGVLIGFRSVHIPRLRSIPDLCFRFFPGRTYNTLISNASSFFLTEMLYALIRSGFNKLRISIGGYLLILRRRYNLWRFDLWGSCLRWRSYIRTFHPCFRFGEIEVPIHQHTWLESDDNDPSRCN